MNEYLVKVFYSNNVDITDSLSVFVIDRALPGKDISIDFIDTYYNAVGVPYINHIDKHIGVRLFSIDQESVITQALPIMYDWVCKNQPLLSSLIARLELVIRYNKIMYKIHVRKRGEIMSENREMVNHPSHYGGEDNPYEAIKVIEAWDLDFCLGNVVKYISRAGKKNRECLLEDLEKAAWYLNREISNMKSSKEEKAKETFYFCFSVARTIADLEDFIDEIISGKLPETHVKRVLCKTEEEALSYATFYGDGGTDIIINITPLSYSEEGDYFTLNVGTKKKLRTIPVSMARMYEYFENAEIITRTAEES